MSRAVLLSIVAALPLAGQDPATEPVVQTTVETGYRWRTDPGGNFNAYRSVVNLGSGPKFLLGDFSLVRQPSDSALPERITARAANWGGEPWSTFQAEALNTRWYDFRASFRDLAWFSFLPSYANPLLDSGVLLNQRAIDARRRFAAISLDLLPNRTLIPIFGWERTSAGGTGVTTFVGEGNEYPVPWRLRDALNLYRGGMRLETRPLHLTVEGGATRYENDQTLFIGDPNNRGNRPVPLLGQTPVLTDLLGAWGIRGESAFARALLTANPFPWLDLYGHYGFSQPESSASYRHDAAGNLFNRSQARFNSVDRLLAAGSARMPRTNAAAGAEIRIGPNLRLLESWLTDRLHTSGSTRLTETLPAGLSQLLTSSLFSKYSQQELNVFWDAAPWLTLRGGHRYVWGDAGTFLRPDAGLPGSERGAFRRHVFLGGLAFRPSQRLNVWFDAEGASSGAALFRNSLYDYQKIRARSRFDLTSTLNIAFDFSLLRNRNPIPLVPWRFLTHQESLAIAWTPADARRWTFTGTYTRGGLESDLQYQVPQDFSVARSLYRDNSHTATALLGYSAPRAQFTAGGSLFRSSGSRPTHFYQPLGRLLLPVAAGVSFLGEWRYFGFGEPFYTFEGFRTHLVTAGLRVTR